MQAMLDLKLDVIDHRSWHAKFENIVMNEMYVKSMTENANSLPSPDEILQFIKTHLEKCICQEVSHDAVLAFETYLVLQHYLL